MGFRRTHIGRLLGCAPFDNAYGFTYHFFMRKISILFAATMIILATGEGSWGSGKNADSVEDDCHAWLGDNKISSSDPDCTFKCLSAPVDMGTFLCHEACEKACAKSAPTKKKCEVSSYWQSRFNGPTTPFKALNDEEKDRVERVLSQLPNSWRPKALKSIVKGSKPADITSMTSPAISSDEYVILFPRAFDLSQEDLERVVSHEVSHLLISNEWSSLLSKYKQAVEWPSSSTDKGQLAIRPGQFVDADGKFSPEEDMANNIEYFIFEPSTLKSKCPKIFAWLQKTMGKDLKKQKGCANEK